MILFGLVAIAASQPVDDETAAAPAAIPIEKTIEPVEEDMDASESSLKVIEHKLEHWLKKCYKKGGCGSSTDDAKI